MNTLFLLLRSNQIYLVLNSDFESMLQFDQLEGIIKNGRILDFRAFEQELKSVVETNIENKWYARNTLNAMVSVPKSYSPSDTYILLNSIDELGVDQAKWTYHDFAYLKGLGKDNKSILLDIDDYEIRISELLDHQYSFFETLPIGSKTFPEIAPSNANHSILQHAIKDKISHLIQANTTIYHIGNKVNLEVFDDIVNIKYDEGFIKKSMLGIERFYSIQRKAMAFNKN